MPQGGRLWSWLFPMMLRGGRIAVKAFSDDVIRWEDWVVAFSDNVIMWEVVVGGFADDAFATCVVRSGAFGGVAAGYCGGGVRLAT